MYISGVALSGSRFQRPLATVGDKYTSSLTCMGGQPACKCSGGSKILKYIGRKDRGGSGEIAVRSHFLILSINN